MVREKIINELKRLTGHSFVEITTRGNTAIKAALSVVEPGSVVFIPREGGWLTYQTLPLEMKMEIVKVACHQSKINLKDLEKKLKGNNGKNQDKKNNKDSKKKDSKQKILIYSNPGGYFAEQETTEIYSLCQKENCLVIMDVAGCLGTDLCRGKDADLIVGSFGRWKTVDAGKCGFISTNHSRLWKKIQKIDTFDDEIFLLKIWQKLEDLPKRLAFLQQARDAVVNDLLQKEFAVFYPKDFSLVVVVGFSDDEEKERIINYCKINQLEWTECPRYIRVLEKAISIEIKRLSAK